MDSGTLVAFTSAVSTVVIVVTAVAAFRQLRHDRNANDIVVYLRLVDRMDSDDVRVARSMLETLDERLDASPALRARQFASPEAITEIRPVVELLRYLEHISVLVIRGEIAEELILAEYAEIFVEIWQNGRVSIHNRRATLGPFTGRAFEHLAMRSKRYIESGKMAREYEALERDPALPVPAPRSTSPAPNGYDLTASSKGAASHE